MKNISEYINENGYDEIIRKNLAEISDEDITNEVRDYEGDNLSQKDILTVWNHLKSLNSNKVQAWIVPPTADIDDYNRACVKWAKDTAKKYGVAIVVHLLNHCFILLVNLDIVKIKKFSPKMKLNENFPKGCVFMLFV